MSDHPSISTWRERVQASLRGDRAVARRALRATRRALGGVQAFFGVSGAPAAARSEVDSQIAIFESGEELIDRIQDAITLRRSVLVTGPRGSGKTYCALEAIRRAEKGRVIAGHHFLQGNREIPRDYLSEDMLVIREVGKGKDRRPSPALLDAMLLRLPGAKASAMRKYRRERFREFEQSTGWGASEAIIHLKEKDKFSVFPALTRLPEASLGKDVWKPGEWVVLFLDEINRFGDGFLDSLLSLTEERVIVRGGTKLHVPIVVVATANPPGYDITAKKLSPPLQARISRAYRISQPTHETLAYLILPDLIRRYEASYRAAADATGAPSVRVDVSEGIRQLVSGAALALWGLPDPRRKGVGFLTPQTQRLLAEATAQSASLEEDMRQLGDLITFGPDARSVGDWIGCAMGLARREPDPDGVARVTEAHLMACALESLGHKVRENFNEGADPGKVALKERLISRIVRAVLYHRGIRQVFQIPYTVALQALPPPGELLQSWIDQLGRGHRGLVEALAHPTTAPLRDSRTGALHPGRMSAPEWSLLRKLAREARAAAQGERVEAERLEVSSQPSEEALRNAADRRQLAERLERAAGTFDAMLNEHAADPVEVGPHLDRCARVYPELEPWSAPIRAAVAALGATLTLEQLAAFIAASAAFVMALEGAPEVRRGALARFSPALDDALLQLLVGRAPDPDRANGQGGRDEAQAAGAEEISPTIAQAMEQRLADLFGSRAPLHAPADFPLRARRALRAAFADEVVFGLERTVYAADQVIARWWSPAPERRS